MNKINTYFVNPPIPIRQFDWSAVRVGYDEDDPVGYGATEADAIANLLELEEENLPISDLTP